MALPPIVPVRSDSPERGVSPPAASPVGPRGAGPLAPLRGLSLPEATSSGGAHVAGISRAGAGASSGSGPARSVSGGPDTTVSIPGTAGPSAAVSPSGSASPSGRGSAVSPRVASGPRKLTKAQLTERLHGQLMEVLRTEWRRIKSSNLGVLSGTAVVEELLLRRIQAWAAELHMLAMTHLSAAERLGQLCRAMDAAELQHLLVMFDQTGHPELSDYVRVLVFNTSDPSAKTVVGDLRALRAANSRRARSTPSNRRRQAPPPPPPPRTYQHTPEDPSVMRFAGLLPEGHRLVAGAHKAAARRKQDEEDERRAAEAREARARARLGTGTVDAQDGAERQSSDVLRQSMLLRNAQPELLPYYLADVEEAWRRTISTRAPWEGIFDSVIMLQEPLPMYEAPPEAALMRVEAEEAAAAAAVAPPLRLGLANAGRVGAGGARGAAAAAAAAAAATAGGGGGSGGGTWPLAATNAATAFKRLTSARPGAHGAAQVAAGDSGGGGGAGGGGGGAGGADVPPTPRSGQMSSRFPGASRRGPRLVSLPAEGADGGEGSPAGSKPWAVAGGTGVGVGGSLGTPTGGSRLTLP